MRPSTMKHEHRITIFSFYYTRKGPSTFHLRKTSGKMRAWAPTPHTLHPACYTLHPAPYTTHPSPCMLRPTPYTLHPTPYNLHPAPYTLHPTPYTCARAELGARDAQGSSSVWACATIWSNYDTTQKLQKSPNAENPKYTQLQSV